jgi:type IV secretion system protein VirB6
MDYTGHAFTSMFEAFNTALGSITGKYAAIIGIVSGPLRAAIVIYITLLGYAIMRGAVQYPFREYVYRGCQLAFLYFAVTSLYGAQIGMFALAGLPSQFANALGGADAGGLGGFYDQLAGAGFEAANTMRKIAETYQATQGTLPDIGYAVFSGFLIVLVVIATILCAAIGFTITAFGLFALALLTVVGPLFVAALIFDSTRQYFFSWLGACINYLMLIVFCLVLTLFITETGKTLLATITDGDDILVAGTKAAAFYFLGFFFFIQIPGIAASLGGGGAASITQFGNAVLAATGARQVMGGIGTSARGGAAATGRAIGRGISAGYNRVRGGAGSVSRAT